MMNMARTPRRTTDRVRAHHFNGLEEEVLLRVPATGGFKKN